MYLKRSAVLIICGLLLVVLSTACSGTTGNTPNTAATTATGTQQANNQTNGTSQLDNQNTRADGQVTPTPAPTKASNQSSNKGHDADDQNKTSNNQSAMQPTPKPAVNTKTSSQNSNNNDNSYNNKNSAQAAAPTTTSGGTLYIRTQMVTINGTSTKVLTNGQGMTLYYRTSDPAPASTCTGNCAATWPPLLNHNMSIITSQTLNGTLTVQQTANGPQVLYNNHPLYTYVGDNAAGQANGHGLNGVWYVVQVQAQKMHW
jgi:predicted lipoprotein with Yx(FWY)xxD motif